MNPYNISISDKKLVAKNTWELTLQCLETGTLNILGWCFGNHRARLSNI